MNLNLLGKYNSNEVIDQRNSEAFTETILHRLRSELLAHGYPKKKNYSLGNAVDDDCLSLSKDGNVWAVFYVERGVRFSPAFFLDIDDAIAYFIFQLSEGDLSYFAVDMTLRKK